MYVESLTNKSMSRLGVALFPFFLRVGPSWASLSFVKQNKSSTMELTANRRAVLALLPKISSSLSIIGTTWILVEVSTHSSKRKQIYHRLMVAWSAYQLLASVFMFLSTWPIPDDGRGDAYHNALGNNHTCQIQGFFLQLELGELLCRCCCCCVDSFGSMQ